MKALGTKQTDVELALSWCVGCNG